MLTKILLPLVLLVALVTAVPTTVPVQIREPENYTQLATANESALFRIDVANASTLRHPYEEAPLLVKLKGKREQIGYDYAALLGEQTSYTYNTFLGSLFGSNNTAAKAKLAKFTDFLWDRFYTPHIPKEFLIELKGMERWAKENPTEAAKLETLPHVVSRHFFCLANMPADAPNIISGLEYELERGWPEGLKELVNDIIKILEHYIHSCDAYGVWGSRTEKGRLYTSRNLDYNPDTGINKYKLIQVYDIEEENAFFPSKPANPLLRGNAKAAAPNRKKYAAMGFTFGLGALAGQSEKGITTSEMNLDNSHTTFSGLPFPLRLRYVLENAHDLQSAMTVWNATNNTNSFNFLIGSAADVSAFALETMRNYTGVFPDNSPVEANSHYDCHYPPHLDPTCKKWAPNSLTNKSQGEVPIGFPLKEAVWRTNHGMNPVIMRSQEPLFNDTIFRYNLLHNLFAGYEESNTQINDEAAVRIVATLGIKGPDFLTCHESFARGSNVLSVVYVPGEKRFFVAWERGAQATWRPAGCAPYLAIDMTRFW